MLGTFGMRPKATMGSRALGMAQMLCDLGWDAAIFTVPWDYPSDAGRSWTESDVQVRNTRVTSPYLCPMAVAEIVRYARAFKPDLIHIFKPKGFGDLAARWLDRTYPVVVDMDDWEGNGGWNDSGLYPGPQQRLFDWQERTLPRRARAVTIASQVLKDRALEGGTGPRGVFYIPNGLTTARFDMLSRSCRNKSGQTILLYTRFVEFDPATIAEVLAMVRRSVPETKLLVAGGSSDGASEGRLKAAAERLGVAQVIEWAGWVEPSDLAEIAARCRLAIHPFDDTLLNRAKCSVKLLELMACGLPVVTTPVGENASFIEEGRSGLLVKPSDASGLAAAVVDLLDNPRRCDQIGRAARARVGEHFLLAHRAA